MIEEIKQKLDKDINCNLSIEELKILYGINISNYDITQYIEIIKYIDNRNKYEDLIKIFNKKYVARHIYEINVDTICIVGSLTIQEILPTYNLRYIYGNLYYELDKIVNLENLELIIGDGLFLDLKESKGLENLSIIYKEAYFRYLESSEGLSSLKIVGYANFENLRNSKGLENLEIINGNANFKLLQSAEGLISLRKIYRNAYFTILKSSKGLEKLEYIGGEAVFRYLENADGLCNLKIIKGNAFFESLKDSKGLYNLKMIGGYCSFYSLPKFNSIERIYGHLSIKYEDNNILEYLNRVYGIEVDSVKKVALNYFNLNDSTEVFINDLNIDYDDKFYPNLKYVIGNFIFQSDKLSGIKNLKKVFGSAVFKYLKSAESLENLEYISSNAIFTSLESIEGLENLKYIGSSEQFGKDCLTFEEFKNIIKVKRI